MTDLDWDDAVDWLSSGGLIAFPTETVWGLAADARSEASIKALRSFKRRDEASPLSILVTGPPALDALGFRVGAAARRLAQAFWPGPLTLVIGCDGDFAPGVARGDGSVGVRCSSHPVASALAAHFEMAGCGPLTATSCNESGAPPARSRAEARLVCEGDERVRLLAGGTDSRGEAPSTVVDVSGSRPRVLRWGAVAEPVLAPLIAELSE